MATVEHFDFTTYLSYVVYAKEFYVDVDGFNDLIDDIANDANENRLPFFRDQFDSKLKSEVNRIASFIREHLDQCSEDINYVIEGWSALSEEDKNNIYKEKTVKRSLRAIYLRTNRLKSFYKLNCFLISKVAKKFHVLLAEHDTFSGGPPSPGKTDTFSTWKGSCSFSDFEHILCVFEKQIKDIQKRCVEFSGTIGSETYPYLAAGHLKYGSKGEVDSVTNKTLLGMKIGFFIGIICVIIFQSTITRSNKFKLWKSYGLFVFSVVGGVMVFNVTWAMSIRVWTMRKINYLSIFQIPHLEPNTFKVLQESGTIMCVFAMCLFWFFETGRDGGQVHNHAVSVACPLILLVFVTVRLINKVIKGRTSNNYGQGDALTVVNPHVLYKCLIAPFAAVTFRDNYVADVLTSFNKVISDGIYGGCWVLTGAFLKDENDLIDEDDNVMCSPENMANVSTVVISFVLWIRMAQCGRRFYDSGTIHHLFNILKYALALAVAVVGRFVVDGLDPYYMTLVVTATLYKWYWDVAMDWGLLADENYSTPPYFLRPKRYFRQAYIYYVVIFLDLVMRFLWIISLMPADLQGQLFGNYLSIQLGYIEILRRAMWGIFRVEWEHVQHEHKKEFGFCNSAGCICDDDDIPVHQYRDEKSFQWPLLDNVEDVEKDVRPSIANEYRHRLDSIGHKDDDDEASPFLVDEE